MRTATSNTIQHRFYLVEFITWVLTIEYYHDQYSLKFVFKKVYFNFRCDFITSCSDIFFLENTYPMKYLSNRKIMFTLWATFKELTLPVTGGGWLYVIQQILWVNLKSAWHLAMHQSDRVMIFSETVVNDSDGKISKSSEELSDDILSIRQKLHIQLYSKSRKNGREKMTLHIGQCLHIKTS